jgi:signal transduction histidine kinase
MPEARLAVLLVEDQPLDRRALVRFVETEGLPYDVVGVASLAEAGTQLARRTFDVAIVEQRLGDGIGIDLLPTLLGTPAVILTRPGDEAIAAHAIQAGAYGLLVRDSGRRYLHLLVPTISAVLARRRAEIAASARAEEQSRTREDFQRVVTMMWHEVMGPLTTLLSTLEMVEVDAEANPTVLPTNMRSMLRQGMEIATNLERLINDVLGYYRLNTSPALAPVDLDALVAETIESLPLTTWHDAVVEKDKLPETTGDPTRLRLLFRQLFDNARTMRGSHPLVIHVAATNYDDAVRISITDNGVGSSSDEADYLVDAYTTPADGTASLGIAICRRIVEQHGGRMWCEPTIGVGTTVYVTLPRTPALRRAAGD